MAPDRRAKRYPATSGNKNATAQPREAIAKEEP
jgi:hypothetical protein